MQGFLIPSFPYFLIFEGAIDFTCKYYPVDLWWSYVWAEWTGNHLELSIQPFAKNYSWLLMIDILSLGSFLDNLKAVVKK